MLGSRAKAAAHEGQAIQERRVYERDPAHRIQVPDELTRPHRLLRPRRGQTTTIRPALREKLWRKCYGRSLRIMDALFKALDERGLAVEAGDGDRSSPLASIIVNGQALSIDLTEKVERVKR